VGRLPRAYLAITAALGLSGCLLFTDPINKAPVVTIHQVTNSVVRGSPAEFTATVADEDKPQSWQLDWAVFNFKNSGCAGITAADWASPTVNIETKDSTASYLFPAQTLETVCLCARATDHNGATGQSCLPITPVNPTPIATIEDVSGILSGQPRPLCSQVHLSVSAERSTFPTDDHLLSGEHVQFDWSLTYSGVDAAGKSVQLSKCTGFETGKPKSDQHRCFYAAGPGTDTGTYKVTLKITDSVVLNGNTTPFPSDPAIFVIPVDKDTPPCLQRTDPDVYSQRILLSRNADLGGTYQSRTFTALSVKDDCNPFPPVPLPGGATSTPPQFVWSVLDSTQASPSWIQQVNATPSFTVSQVMFPNARPGDTIGLRVEIRDSAVQDSIARGGQVCSIDPPKDSPAICCGSACGSPNDCVRWTTWTVQFQP
jgi:hypothetical protein